MEGSLEKVCGIKGKEKKINAEDIDKAIEMFISKVQGSVKNKGNALESTTVDLMKQAWMSSTLDLFKSHSSYLKYDIETQVNQLLAKYQYPTDFKQTPIFTFFTE